MSNRNAVLDVDAGESWIGRGRLLGLGLLVILSLTFTALDYLVPKAPGQEQGASTRVGWYLRSGQWHADLRTLATVFEFVMDPVPETPVGTNSPTQQLAAPSRPADLNPPALTQVKDGNLRLPNS